MAGDINWATWTSGANTIIKIPHIESLRPDFDAADDGTQAMKEAIMAAKIDALEQRIKQLEEKINGCG